MIKLRQDKCGHRTHNSKIPQNNQIYEQLI